MDYSKSLLATTVAASLKEAFKSQNPSAELVEECTRRIMEAAIEIRELQTGRLVALNEIEKDLPILIHYKPRTAGQILVALVAGIAGASNPLTLYLAILACALALGDMREQASESEALLFSIVFESTNHQLRRDHAKEKFTHGLTTLRATSTESFEIALHSLVKRGCLKILGENILISDPIVIRRRDPLVKL